MRTLMLFVLTLSFSVGAWAHLCDDIFRTPDRILVKPEKEDLIVQTGETVRVFVRNNYPLPIANVRMAAEVDRAGVRVTVEPAALQKLLPATKDAFTLRLDANGAPEGKYEVKLRVSADNIGWMPVREPGEDELLQVLNDPNVSPRVLACESLAKLGNEEGIEHLRGILGGNSGREYQVRGIRAVGRSGNKELARLIVPFVGSRDGLMRGMALLSLGLLRSELDMLRAALPDRDPFVSCAAATGLVLADDYPAGLPDELKQFMYRDNPWVQVAAAWGTAALEDNDDALRILADAVQSWDAELVVMAGDALLNLAERREKKDAEEPVAVASPDRWGNPDGAEGPRAIVGVVPDRLFYNPIMPLPVLDEGGVLRIQLYHTYPAPLHDVTVTVAGPGLSAAAPAVAALRPAEKRTFEIELGPLASHGSDATSVTVTIASSELREPASFEIALPNSAADRSVVESQLAQPVGSLVVHVTRFGNLHTLAWGVPLVAVIALLAWRWRRQARPRRLAT